MSLLTLLGRGALAGALGGLLTGLVSLLLAEPVIDKAVMLQHQAAAAAGEAGGGELFTRDTQHVGLVVTSVLTGIALGVIFSVVYAWLYRRDPAANPWGRSLLLATAGFVGISLLPFLRFPASPPGAGDPLTVDARSTAWIAAIILGIVTMALAAQVHGWLRQRGVAVPWQQLGVAGVVIAGFALLFLLPGSTDVSGVPADLLWTFRLTSLLALAMLWAGLGVTFGLFNLRGARAAAG